MRIRKSTLDDLDQILGIYAYAREFMKKTGNPDQWKDSYPSEELVKSDILKGSSYLGLAEGEGDEKDGESLSVGEIMGTFYFAVEEEPTYKEIKEGSWLNQEPYGVVHRVAASGKGRGFAKSCFDWAGLQCRNLKIDTHRDNQVMQHVLERNGFRRCGVIYLENGEERLAYQRCQEWKNIENNI